jgi:DNA-binding HxlR family transcriptional regulator
MKVHHGCPVQATIQVLSGKWKVQAVWRLSFGPLRFAELRNLLQGVSEKVLTAQLRELEKDGVVTRREVRSSPPKVTYSLSRSGETLVPLLESLCDWAPNNLALSPICPAIRQYLQIPRVMLSCSARLFYLPLTDLAANFRCPCISKNLLVNRFSGSMACFFSKNASIPGYASLKLSASRSRA